MRIALKSIALQAIDRPDGYYEDVVDHGVVISDELELSKEAFDALHAKYAALPTPRLSLREKAVNFGRATVKWARHGFPTRSLAEFLEVAAICEACPYWLQDRAIQSCAVCGCGEIKHEWATERCPIGKWGGSKTT